MCIHSANVAKSFAIWVYLFHGLLGNFAVVSSARVEVTSSSSMSYELFRQIHRSEQEDDPVSYGERNQIFEARKATMLTHNEKNLSWKLALNYFSDFTQSELKALMGYKRVGGRWKSSSGSFGTSFLQVEERVATYDAEGIDISQLASELDWRSKLNMSNFIHNQGPCGSCWAHAAVGAIEAHMELAGMPGKELSFQQVVDCTPNPKHCGGTGGCHGATTELAFERARRYGIVMMDAYKGSCDEQVPSAVKIQGFVRLPENSASHLLHAVATKGPVTVSVDAGPWFSYGGGVFSGCGRDAVVGHAVLAVGYGKDSVSGKDYWLIKNSWGSGWGEDGYIRIERMGDGEYCGVDNKPKAGVYCDDAPSSIKVCGMCGITSDSTYPVLS